MEQAVQIPKRAPEKLCKTGRNYGIDLLRIVSMYMVVILHILGEGGILRTCEPFSSNGIAAWFLEIMTLCAVNCYALISGYVGYGKKQKISSIVTLSAQVIFYIVTITAVCFFADKSIGIADVKRSLLGIIFGDYWYFTAYFCAFFFFPCLNMLMEKLDEKSANKLVISLFVLFSLIPTMLYRDIFKTNFGYSPLWLMVLYIFGAYAKKFQPMREKSAKFWFGLYGVCAILGLGVLVLESVVLKREFAKSNFSCAFLAYTSPVILFEAVALFMAFSKIKVKGIAQKIVAFLVPLTFGVYLIHTQYFLWTYIGGTFSHFAKFSTVGLIASVLTSALGLYFSCSLIDFIRNLIFTTLKRK